MKKTIRIGTLLTIITTATIAMSACENTYKGAGRDLDNVSDEMKDGWN